MKSSTVHHINHDIADFQDRNRHNSAEAKPSPTVEEALRSSKKFTEGVEFHDRKVVEDAKKEELRVEKAKRLEAINKRNWDAYDSGDVKSMTYLFLGRAIECSERLDVVEAARKELARRDSMNAKREAFQAKEAKKQADIEDRNHRAMTALPKDFRSMTHGLLQKLAAKDQPFIASLRDRGYNVSDFDTFDAGFELGRRVSNPAEKIANIKVQLADLGVDPVYNAQKITSLTYTLNKLEGVTEAQEAW